MSGKPKTAGPARQRWSLVTRLTCHYVLVTTLLLILAAGILYWALHNVIDYHIRTMIANKVEVFRPLVHEQTKRPNALMDKVGHETGANHPLSYFLRIIDQHQITVIETDGMNDLLPVSAFPAPVIAAAQSPTEAQLELLPYGKFTLCAVRIGTGNVGDSFRTLQIALDTSWSDAMLNHYRFFLHGALLVGVLLATLIGITIARQGLQPLSKMAQKSQYITANKLSERLASPEWPKELTLLAQAFDKMLGRFEEAFQRLTLSTADMAHALRNPINSLRGEAEVALTRVRTPKEYQQVIGSSLEELDRLSRLIDGLLFIARADDPGKAVEHTIFTARKEMDAVNDFYAALATEKKVTVACRGEASLKGDHMLFRRAVSNLLANALRYTPANGTVTLSVGEMNDGRVVVEVQDTGRGVSPCHLDRIFERFYRGDAAHSDPNGGAGLGLAIVHSIMQQHGGTAAVTSVVGQGTSVKLTFPSANPLPVKAG